MAMGHWKSTSPELGTLTFGRWSWLMALPLMFVVVPLSLGGMPGEFGIIVGWAMAATLTWHALFCRHRLVIDRGRGLLRHSIRSLYPVVSMEIPLAQLSGFCVTNSPLQIQHYDLMLMLEDGQRICLFKRGGLQEMEQRGKQLAEFCQVRYARECN